MRLDLRLALNLILALAMTCFVAVAHAKTPGPAAAEKPGFDRKAELDKVFDQFAKAKNETQSLQATDNMWRIFMTTPDEQTAEDLNQALRALRAYYVENALVIINRIIERHPDYAEAWNQRAYIHFIRERYDEAVADCQQVLVLEPRHIGCLTGMARILIRRTKNYEGGRKFLEEALRLNPFLFERKLLDEIPGDKI